MPEKSPIKLYFLTGFLGSGKTTLMNNLLDYLAEKGEKAGVIVNEWGQVGIDGSLIHNHGIEIKELNNGQIFCSCLVGSFVKALVTFADYPLKYLLVETSGLANPVSLKNVLVSLKALTGIRYDYRGMISLVDPENFLDLVGTVNAVEEQVISSQYLIINKIDLVDEETICQVKEKIRELNHSAPVYQTSFSKVDTGIFDLDPRLGEIGDVVRNVKVPYKRPVHYVVTAEGKIDPAQVADFAQILLKDAFRIKGFINSEAGWFYLDGVNGKVDLRPVKAQGKETKIVIISRIWEEIVPNIKLTWQKYVGNPLKSSSKCV
ncbi:MAG: CobW family GTP-binding protein [Dehalobacterium sp.]